MNDMQKLGLFLAKLFNKLGDFDKMVEKYEAEIAALKASLEAQSNS